MTRRIAVVLGLALSLFVVRVCGMDAGACATRRRPAPGGPWARPGARLPVHLRRTPISSTRRPSPRPATATSSISTSRAARLGRCPSRSGRGAPRGWRTRASARRRAWRRSSTRLATPSPVCRSVRARRCSSRDSCTTSRPPSAGCARMRRRTASIPIASRSWATAPAAGRRRWPHSPATRPRWRALSARPACRARCRQRWRSIHRPTF